MAGKKGVFGPLVIGEEQAKQEQEEVARGVDYFGPNVLAGDEGRQKPTAQQLKDQPGLAALHGLEPPAPRTATDEPGAPAEPKPPKSQLSIDKLKEALEDNPFILDGCIEAEFERVEGPRKEAIRLFIKEENKKVEENRRVDVLERLAQALTAKPA